MVVLFVTLGLLVIVGIGWLVVRDPSPKDEDRDAPLPLFTSVQRDARGLNLPAPVPASREPRAGQARPTERREAPTPAAPTAEAPHVDPLPAQSGMHLPTVARPVAAAALPAEPVATPLAHSTVEAAPTETIKFSIPAQGTLQFLPGRLEVLRGKAAIPEIRFVRPPDVGAGPVEITFGRSDGIAYRHVQLLAPTVSRLHARMTFAGRQWELSNLSATNPVLRNGVELRVGADATLLGDGDQIEMGEIVFRFRAR